MDTVRTAFVGDAAASPAGSAPTHEVVCAVACAPLGDTVSDVSAEGASSPAGDVHAEGSVVAAAVPASVPAEPERVWGRGSPVKPGHFEAL